MLAFLGDIHGDAGMLERADRALLHFPQVVAAIQVGDFGWYDAMRWQFQKLKLHHSWYWIDGNHEDHSLLPLELQAVAPNLTYVPRGTVLELDGRRVLFCGGAGRVDKQIRLRRGLHWSAGENISSDTMFLLGQVRNIDLMVTHCPPQRVIQRHFDPQHLVDYFDLPIDWADTNADIIETAWLRLGKPQLICGHMHRSLVDETVRILDVNELYVEGAHV